MNGPINLDIKILTKTAHFFFLVLVLGILGCKSQRTTESSDKEDDGLVLLLQDAYSGIDQYETMVITDQKALNAFYGKINRTRKPGLPVPQLDFSKEMALIVCMGEQLGDDLPDIIKKRESDQEIVLQVNPYDYEKDDHTTLISSPFCVYKMPLTNKEIVFAKD